MNGDELAAFYAARLDEEEAAANEAASRPLGAAWDDGTRLTAVARHIALHDPERVLADITADRAILAKYEMLRHPSPTSLLHRLTWPTAAGAVLWCICQRAARFSGHPDYKAEWKP